MDLDGLKELYMDFLMWPILGGVTTMKPHKKKEAAHKLAKEVTYIHKHGSFA
jgi:hypothetical protein